jgi:microcystin-dependent protein
MSFRRRKSTVINRTVYQDNKVNYLMAPHSYTEAPVLSFGRANPPGSIIAYTMETAPIGWLICDGSAVNRVIYAALFSVIGTTFGSGDGQFTFNLPDYRGAFLRGSRTGANGYSGPLTNSYQADEIEQHNHIANVIDPGHIHTQTSANDDYNGSGGNNYPNLKLPSFAQYDLAPGVVPSNSTDTKVWTENINSRTTGISVTISNTGSTETRPYNYGVVWLIKY